MTQIEDRFYFRQATESESCEGCDAWTNLDDCGALPCSSDFWGYPVIWLRFEILDKKGAAV